MIGGRSLQTMLPVLALLLLAFAKADDECYTNSTEGHYGLFSTKTSYFQVDNEEAEPIVLQGPIQAPPDKLHFPLMSYFYL